MSNRRISISATFTAEPIQEFLAFWFRELGMDFDIKFASYNQVFQQLLDPGSLVSTNQDGINVILIRWEDLVGNPVVYDTVQNDAWCSNFLKVKTDLVNALFDAAARSKCPFLVHVGPALFMGDQNTSASAHFTTVEKEFFAALDKIPGVYLTTAKQVNLLYPVDQWYDADAYRFGRIPYTSEYFIALASQLARMVFSLTTPERKVIVLDCDNTLWSGVCGEVNPEDLSIDARYLALQRFMAAQAARGRLVCICSKNSEADVWNVFDQREDMVLKREHLVSWRINWQPKSENLIDLAGELQLGLDSFIFVDDNPVECAEVKARCPEVLTLQLPSDPLLIPNFLQHVWAFDKLHVTDTDLQRTRSYQTDSERRRFESRSDSFARFISELDIRIDISPIRIADVPRVSQMTQRTNQFNTTTRRMDELKIRGLCVEDGPSCHVVNVTDRFGDYGLAGVLMGRTIEDRYVVDSFLLSCRALGKGVEYEMLAYAGKLAASLRHEFVDVHYRETSRNQPALIFLRSLRGIELREGDITVFRIPTATAVALKFDPGGWREKDIISSEISRKPKPENLKESETKIGFIAEKLCDIQSIQEYINEAVRPRPELQQPFVVPRPGIEKAVAAIWQEVLYLDKVGALDRFSDIGGTSIHLVRVHSLFLKELKIDLPITAFFQFPTVRSLSGFFAQKEDNTKKVLHSARNRAKLQRNAQVRHVRKLRERHIGKNS